MRTKKVLNDFKLGNFKRGEFIFYLNEPAKVANYVVMSEELEKEDLYYVVEILSTGHFLHIPAWDLEKYSVKLEELEGYDAVI